MGQLGTPEQPTHASESLGQSSEPQRSPKQKAWARIGNAARNLLAGRWGTRAQHAQDAGRSGMAVLAGATDQENGVGHESPNLSEGMKRHLATDRLTDEQRRAAQALGFPEDHLAAEQRLAVNAWLTPEIQRQLTPEQQEQVRRIRESLLEIPIIHGTRQTEATTRDGIKPARELPEDHQTHTHDIDRSAGLDEYTFFHWGFVERGQYGSEFLTLDPRLLLDPRTIVSEGDIAEISLARPNPPSSKGQGFFPSIDAMSTQEQEYLQRQYFDHIYTGGQWLEIVARRVLANYESGQELFEVDRPSSFGEVKIHGTVDSSYITGRISGKQGLYDYYRDVLYLHGIAFANIEYARRARIAGRQGPVDPTPEDIGVDYVQATRFWKQRLSNRT